MGIFSDAVADSRPRVSPGMPGMPDMPGMPGTPGTQGVPATSPILSDQERGTMISEGEERPAQAVPRQGADPSPQKDDAAAASRAVEGVFRYLKGKRSTEKGTTNGHDKDFGRSEDHLVLGERNRQGSTTNGLHVDLDAHASEPSFSGQTAVSSGPSFKREAELLGTADSKRSNHLSNVSNEELDNGTGVLDGSQNPGKAPLLPEPEAVVPSAVKPAGALPPQEVAAEERRGRVLDAVAPNEASSIFRAETFSAERGDQPGGGASRGILTPRPPLPSPNPPYPGRGGATTQNPENTKGGGSPSPGGGWEGDGRGGQGVRAAGHERPLAAQVSSPVAPPAVFAAPRRDRRDHREAPREPSGPRVQIGRLEVIVVAPAPAVAPAAPAAAPSPKPGALASRRYLRSL
jgi:hypothetical protein